MTAMARMLLVTCLIIGMAIFANAAQCPPGSTRCNPHEGGLGKKELVQELLDSKNLNLDKLDDETLQRALNYLLEDERNKNGPQGVPLEVGMLQQEPDGDDPGSRRRDEHLRELLLKILQEE